MTEPMTFKDNEAAFTHACQFMDSKIFEGAILPALVLDARELAGTEAAVKKDADGTQTVLLMICSDDGGFVVMAQTCGANGPDLEPWDLVAWRAGNLVTKLGKSSEDMRFGWVGHVIGTLEPQWANGSWVMAKMFY